jgi:hypothetical protein
MRQMSNDSPTSIKIGGIDYVAIPAVAKGISSLVFLLCCFFLVVGRLTGEQLVQPPVALSLAFVALAFFGLAFLLQKRP